MVDMHLASKFSLPSFVESSVDQWLKGVNAIKAGTLQLELFNQIVKRAVEKELSKHQNLEAIMPLIEKIKEEFTYDFFSKCQPENLYQTAIV
jgi:hypothetical protein